jgi:hypothetical protein
MVWMNGLKSEEIVEWTNEWMVWHATTRRERHELQRRNDLPDNIWIKRTVCKHGIYSTTEFALTLAKIHPPACLAFESWTPCNPRGPSSMMVLSETVPTRSFARSGFDSFLLGKPLIDSHDLRRNRAFFDEWECAGFDGFQERIYSIVSCKSWNPAQSPSRRSENHGSL